MGTLLPHDEKSTELSFDSPLAMASCCSPRSHQNNGSWSPASVSDDRTATTVFSKGSGRGSPEKEQFLHHVDDMRHVADMADSTLPPGGGGGGEPLEGTSTGIVAGMGYTNPRLARLEQLAVKEAEREARVQAILDAELFALLRPFSVAEEEAASRYDVEAALLQDIQLLRTRGGWDTQEVEGTSWHHFGGMWGWDIGEWAGGDLETLHPRQFRPGSDQQQAPVAGMEQVPSNRPPARQKQAESAVTAERSAGKGWQMLENKPVVSKEALEANAAFGEPAKRKRGRPKGSGKGKMTSKPAQQAAKKMKKPKKAAEARQEKVTPSLPLHGEEVEQLQSVAAAPLQAQECAGVKKSHKKRARSLEPDVDIGSPAVGGQNRLAKSVDARLDVHLSSPLAFIDGEVVEEVPSKEAKGGRPRKNAHAVVQAAWNKVDFDSGPDSDSEFLEGVSTLTVRSHKSSPGHSGGRPIRPTTGKPRGRPRKHPRVIPVSPPPSPTSKGLMKTSPHVEEAISEVLEARQKLDVSLSAQPDEPRLEPAMKRKRGRPPKRKTASDDGGVVLQATPL